MGWAVAVALGWSWIAAYGVKINPGADRERAQRWPHSTSLELSSDGLTLLVFIHPRCPCTSATLRELDRVLASTSIYVPKVIAVASCPPNPTDDWLATATLDRARRLPQATVVVDERGVESARFGAVSSGTVMVFDSAGTRRFAGGVTIARGHEGDNRAAQKLAQAISCSGKVNSDWMPVFGCRLCLPGDAGVGEPISIAQRRS